MPDLDERLTRIEQAIHGLTGVTGELVRENRALVQGLASDRAMLRETLRELSGFVATAGFALDRLERQVGRLADITEAGFTRMQLALAENNRLIQDNNRLIQDNNRLILENNRLILEINRRIDEVVEVIRRLLDILRRGRENGEGPPA
jgi:hypothetical protein